MTTEPDGLVTIRETLINEASMLSAQLATCQHVLHKAPIGCPYCRRDQRYYDLFMATVIVLRESADALSAAQRLRVMVEKEFDQQEAYAVSTEPSAGLTTPDQHKHTASVLYAILRLDAMWAALLSERSPTPENAASSPRYSGPSGPAEPEASPLSRGNADNAPTCGACGGPHRYDVSVPSPIWNDVVRVQGLPDYMCAACILETFAAVGQSFTAELFGAGFEGVRISVQVDG